MIQAFGEQLENVNLITGGGGEFEVYVNGELVFSKKQTGKYPDWREDILPALKARLS